MKWRYWLLSSALLANAGLALGASRVAASADCYQDPVYVRDWMGTVSIGASVRDGACTTDTTILTTLPVGQSVHIIAETDGWYKVQLADGTKGWVGASLLSVPQAGTGDRTLSSEKATPDGAVTPSPTTTITTPSKPASSTPAPTTTGSLAQRLKGYILLEVQANGEAWYVNPTDGLRYYMKDGPTAYQMMREFGLGITDSDLATLQAGNAALVSRLKGDIVLQVQQHGEAYYIAPKDGSVHYLQNGDAAYQVMRQLSLGITDSDLLQITAGDFDAYVQAKEAAKNQTTATPTPSSPSPTDPTTSTPANIPSGVDVAAIDQYWLGKINALRSAKGVRQLVLDTRLDITATEWAAYMASINTATHTRPNGQSMGQWATSQGLPFTTRYSAGGWVTNYFTENIAWNIADGTTTSAEQAMDRALAMFLAEGPSGVHYQTIYFPDWNSVGAGFSWNGSKLYMTFHYASLVLP